MEFPTSHSMRNFDIGTEFSDKIKECNKNKNNLEANTCRSNVRRIYRFVEAGRLSDMADKIHSFIAHLDEDEVKLFKEKFPEMVKISNEFALVEDLRKF